MKIIGKISILLILLYQLSFANMKKLEDHKKAIQIELQDLWIGYRKAKELNNLNKQHHFAILISNKNKELKEIETKLYLFKKKSVNKN